MATKQLNSVNPRNFKEKIELLKKKEAASTANFAAAMRDAREIRQIAVACDPAQFHLKSRATQGILERSLSKACSVPNVGSGSGIFESSTNLSVNRTNGALSQTGYVADDLPVQPTGNGLPHDQTHVHPSNTNGHLMSLLGSPAVPSSGLNPEVSVLTCDPANSLHNWPVSSNQGFNFPNPSTSAFQSFSPANSRATTHCSSALGVGVLSSTAEVPSAFPNRRIHRYASGDQLSFAAGCYTHCNRQTPSNKSHPMQPGALFPPHSASESTASVMHNYPDPTSSTCTPSYYPPVGRSLCTAQTSLGPLHSSSPYCGTQIVGPYQRTGYDNCMSMQHPMVSSRPATSNEGAPMMNTGFNPNIDWRRVSSDSSIHHSLMNYPTSSMDHAVAYNGTAPANSCATSSDSRHTHLPTKPAEALRRHFPAGQSIYGQPNCSYSPGALSSSGASLSPHKIPGSLAEEHVLPAKRPFTGFSTQTIEDSSSDHDYTKMSGLSLEDSSKIRLDQTIGHAFTIAETCPNQPTIVAVSNVAPVVSSASASSTSAPDINVNPINSDFTKAKKPCDNTVSELNASQPFDPGDLDRYLQIPPALLDCESGERWAGRRNSCTMTAEVLSALSTVHNESPLASDRTKCDTNVAQNSCYSKPLAQTDLSVMADVSTDYCSGDTTTAFNSNQMHSSSFQDVASKLGISMTPNDYQLLTNPQLANYVTDETTETQLLG